jgi:hypothetical protein
VSAHKAEPLSPSTKPACHQQRLPPPANTTVSNCFERKASNDRVFIFLVGGLEFCALATFEMNGLGRKAARGRKTDELT